MGDFLNTHSTSIYLNENLIEPTKPPSSPLQTKKRKHDEISDPNSLDTNELSEFLAQFGFRTTQEKMKDLTVTFTNAFGNKITEQNVLSTAFCGLQIPLGVRKVLQSFFKSGKSINDLKPKSSPAPKILLSRVIPSKGMINYNHSIVLCGRFSLSKDLKVFVGTEEIPFQKGRSAGQLIIRKIFSETAKKIPIELREKDVKSNVVYFEFMGENPETKQIQYLLTSPQKRFSYPLFFVDAAKNYSLEDLRRFRDQGGFSLLHWSCGQGDFELTKLLLELGFDVNRRDYYGSSPIHWALENKDESICKLLLEKGAEWDFENDSGITPLELAKENNLNSTLELIRTLEQAKGPKVEEEEDEEEEGEEENGKEEEN